MAAAAAAAAIAGLVPNLSNTLGRRDEESVLHFVGSAVIFLMFGFDILSPSSTRILTMEAHNCEHAGVHVSGRNRHRTRRGLRTEMNISSLSRK